MLREELIGSSTSKQRNALFINTDLHINCFDNPEYNSSWEGLTYDSDVMI
jgi:hypothetical protein